MFGAQMIMIISIEMQITITQRSHTTTQEFLVYGHTGAYVQFNYSILLINLLQGNEQTLI